MVDLQNKSPEFLELYSKANPLPNARAKVPLLQVGDDYFLCESLVMSEYIAESYGQENELLPKQANERATMRLFQELCGSTFSYLPILRAKGDEAAFQAAVQSLKEGLVEANSFLAHTAAAGGGEEDDDGPFVLGKTFSLAECNMAPFVQRCCNNLPAFTGEKTGVPLVDPLKLCEELNLPRLKLWIEAVLSRSSVVKTGVTREDMIESASRMLERFAAASASK